MSLGLDLAQEQSEYFAALVEFTETREPRAKLALSQRLAGMRDRNGKPASTGTVSPPSPRDVAPESVSSNAEVTAQG